MAKIALANQSADQLEALDRIQSWADGLRLNVWGGGVTGLGENAEVNIGAVNLVFEVDTSGTVFSNGVGLNSYLHLIDEELDHAWDLAWRTAGADDRGSYAKTDDE